MNGWILEDDEDEEEEEDPEMKEEMEEENDDDDDAEVINPYEEADPLNLPLISYGYIKNHIKTVKNGQARTQERKSEQKPEAKARKSQISSQSWSTEVSKTQNIPK
ncbi:hypothetical protein Tco_0279355 [Tanacetum coccineum]